jgi:dienelactone hydrolase
MSSITLPLAHRRTVTARHTFVAATAAVIVHIADAELVRPAAGTSARDHLSAALIPILVAIAGCLVYGLLRPGLRAALAFVFGSVSLVAAFIAVDGHQRSSVLLVPAAVALLAVAIWTPWAARGNGGWRNRILGVAAVPVLLLFVIAPLGTALWATGKPRSPIGTFAVPHANVSFESSDGLRLSGWYVASRNGAAVILVHGGGGSRDGAKRHAALLAHAGYGVLLYDARGRGRSEGSPDAYGWTWTHDVDGAIAFLHDRGIKRIGALGLSTGADVLIEVAAKRHDLRAVVADGTTAESPSDVAKILGGADVVTLPFWWAQYAAASVLTDTRPSGSLAEAARHVAPTRFLFIASSWPVERKAAPLYAKAAHAPLWRVDAGHTGGLREHPRAYAARVLGFFARTLLDRSAAVTKP